MRIRRTLALAACCVAAAWACRAKGETVALVRPGQAPSVLADAFNRLRAELRLHHFEVAEVDAKPDEPSAERLAIIAEGTHAIASVAFSVRADRALIEMWLLDRVSGEASTRTLEVELDEDAASTLAFRAVDVLTTSFPDVERLEPPRRAPAPAAKPIETPPHPTTLPPRPNFRLRVQGVALYDGRALGFAYGPALGLNRVLGRLELGLAIAGPLLGARLESIEGTASLRQELAFVDARIDLVRTEAYAVSAALGVGLHFLQAEGRAEPPLRSKNDAVFGALLSAGADAELFVSRSVALTLSLSALALAPKQGVELHDARAELALPLLQSALGMAVGL